jgi:3-keto-disaccharide hydrolase
MAEMPATLSPKTLNYIRRILLGAALLTPAVTAVAQDQPNTLTPAQRQEGWKLLFDGTSLAGWEARPTSNPSTDGDWAVAEGALVCPGTSAGWLGTTERFSNYHLTLDFRGSEKVNSGVFIRSDKQGQPHITGYELQIWDYQPGGFNTGSLVGTAKAAATRILPDEWNHYDITADGDHYTIVLNGTTLLDTHDSKHSSGVVGFQCQKDNKIEFRNIKLLPLRH